MIFREDLIDIDGAQFFDNKLIAASNQLANWGVRMIEARLDQNFKRKPFDFIP